MKKIIFGTIAAATVIAAATAASAQNRIDRNWTEMRTSPTAESSYEQPARRAKQDGGEGGIRTHGTLARTTVFETVPIDHSGTSPGTRL